MTKAKEELGEVDGEWYYIISWEKPSVCQKCNSSLIDHPNHIDINGHPVLVCTSNINNQDHWVLWHRRR